MTEHFFSVEFVQSNPQLLIGILITSLGLVIGYFFGQFVERTLTALGINDTMAGSEFESGLNKLRLSTVSLFSHLSSWFVYILSVFIGANIMGYFDQTFFWDTTFRFLPQIFTAIVVLLIGVVLADKSALLIQDRLEEFKLPRLVVLPNIAKYTIVYIASLVALGQIGIETTALIGLLVVYVFGLILFGAIATRRLLAAGASGIYILLIEPYEIGDSITIGEKSGVVQEVEVLFTYLETDDGTEYIVPNNKVFDYGIRRDID